MNIQHPIRVMKNDKNIPLSISEFTLIHFTNYNVDNWILSSKLYKK